MVDRRKKYIAVVDTETVNGLDDNFVYDIGYAIVDKKGHVYCKRSFLIKEIFCDNYQMMFTAFFANKLPRYFMDIQNQKIRIEPLYHIRKTFIEDCAEYGCITFCAHNANFDVKALNNTMRYVTKSRKRYFLPYGFVVWDTMKMAQGVICNMPTYKKYCKTNNALSARYKRPSAKAEHLYRFIANQPGFEESHTGLEDVLIEKEILAYCLRRHKKMQKCAYKRDYSYRQVPEPEEARIARYVAEMWGE